MNRIIQYLVVVLLVAGSISEAVAQQDPVLFTVENEPVRLSEFQYIYGKNNGKDADYSRESVEEYLDLYIKFKLKVHKAREMKLDTIIALQKELEGYRKQLANSYLTDKEVLETLMKEVYERQKTDVEVKHILISISENAPESVVAANEKKATEIYNRIMRGESFEKLANTLSNDRNSSNKGGNIGFLTAMLPDGFYAVENAVYNMHPGEVSKPVRSKMGYHILKVESKRTARGEIEVAHILLRSQRKGKPVENVKERMDSIYNALVAGADFAKLAKQYSDDKVSQSKGGNIGKFGINRYEKGFEDAAFSLQNDGDFTQPIESSIGWHIIKRISKTEQEPYEKEKRKLQAKVMKDQRFEIAKQSMIDRIKSDANFKENPGALTNFIGMLDENFYSYQWQVPNLMDELLFQFGTDGRYSVSNFATYCKNNNRVRLRLDKKAPLDKSVRDMYDSYVNEQALSYEEQHLENKYPEFKSLMREYEEGILLFEATKINVWDKASSDTLGLNEFYSTRKNNYEWKERATVHEFKVKTLDDDVLKKVMKYAKRKSPEEVMNKYNIADSTFVSYTEHIYERGSRELSGYKFKKKSLSSVEKNERKGTSTFKKISAIQPSTLKTMSEARGYIVADYQDYLEKKWVSKLRNKYEVVVNKDELEQIIK